MDLLKLLYTSAITLEQADDIFDENQRKFHRGEIKEDWSAAFELSRYEATAYLHGGTLADLAKVRYEGWPTTCSRCHRPIDYKLFGWWFVRGDDGVPQLKHIKCPSVLADGTSETDGDGGSSSPKSGLNIRIKISDGNLPAFLAYLGLGTLYAMRKGLVPMETGIWALARPDVWAFLFKQSNMPRRLIEVYQTADKLSAIKTPMPNKFDSQVEKLMDDLERELAKMKDPTMKHPTWVAEWEGEPTPGPRRRTQARKHEHVRITKRKRNGRK